MHLCELIIVHVQMKVKVQMLYFSLVPRHSQLFNVTFRQSGNSRKFSLVQNLMELSPRTSEEIFVVLNFVPALLQDYTYRQLISAIACTS